MFIDNIPSGYHISKGAEGIFYILNDGKTYISKLSTDLKEAKVKAGLRLFEMPEGFLVSSLFVVVLSLWAGAPCCFVGVSEPRLPTSIFIEIFSSWGCLFDNSSSILER